MKDLTLVNLNMLFVRHYDRLERELHVPLGPLYLTRALEDAGFTVDFRDYQLNDLEDPFSPVSLLEFVKEPAEVIGFSVMANLLPFTLLAMKTVKERYPDRILVLGGVGPKSVEREIIERFPWVDIIAMGEGELSGPILLRTLQEKGDLAGVPGISFRRHGGIEETPRPPRIERLDGIPFPAFEHIDLKKYAGYGVLTSRGCPYPCTFCSVAPIWDRRSYFRSPANIIAEMRHVHEAAGADLFLFQDEFFLSSKARVLEFCHALKASGLPVEWKAFGRVDLTDEETMRAMAACGCLEIRYGIESGSASVLERTRKGFGPNDAVRVVSTAVRHFPRVDTFFIWGFPFETMADFFQTLFQMISFRTMGSRVLPSLLCFLPQTDIYAEYRESGRFTFCPDFFPEYMVTGHEVCRGARVEVRPEHRPIFDFIAQHRDLFPGFFHYDLEGNVLPKLAVLQEFGFYPAAEEGPAETESCGAHSPHVEGLPRRAARAASRVGTATTSDSVG
jgi:radical SAM superfamily enzyme YgiQ (UPF0313 family)